MTPILFPADATTYTTQGLGALSDAISCKVTEERNGEYELEMQYPAAGVHFAEIVDRAIIYAIPSPYRSGQPFRVYRITRPMDGITTIYARHISYDLAGIPINPFMATNAAAAMAGLAANAAVDSPFSFWTDKTTTASFAVTVPTATRSILGGVSGSILDVYGGEYLWDGFTVRLYAQRGADNGVTIRYGKNLTDIEQDRNIANVATGIYPYWADTDGNLVTCNPKIIPAPGTYDFTRVVPVDFSAEYQEAPTPAELQARAETYVKANNIGVPTVSITVSFAQLEQTEEYKALALLEKCDLCDTVTVQYEALGVDAKAEIVKIVMDVLLERYDSIEIGELRTNIASTIVTNQQQTQQQIEENKTFLQAAVDNATKWLTSGNGYVVQVRDENGAYKETLYMDAPDVTTAKNVLRINENGIGFSTSGINGPYRNAWTIDGNLVADFITSGTINAANVKIINLDADNITSGNVNGTFIRGGTIDANLVNVANINASNINTGTLDAGTVNVTNINADNIKTGTIRSNNGVTTLSLDNGRQNWKSTSGNGRLYADGGNFALYNDNGTRLFQLMEYNGEWGHTHDSGAIFWTGQGLGFFENDANDNSGKENAYYVQNNWWNPNWSSYIVNGANIFFVGTNKGAAVSVCGNEIVYGGLDVYGTKNRVVQTEYGEARMGAMESPEPMFCDAGSGTIDATGVCYLELHPIYAATVSQTAAPRWYLTPTGGGGALWAEKTAGGAIIHGEPGTTFDWLCAAIQRGYEGTYCDASASDYFPGPDMDTGIIDEGMETIPDPLAEILTAETINNLLWEEIA